MAIRDLDAKRRLKTLAELEGVATDAPPYDSYVMGTCHRLRKKPIGEFSVEDLRIMIGQNIGLFFLVPLALDILEPDPLVEGDFYPGDLLCALLRADPGYWERHSDQQARLGQIIGRIADVPDDVARELDTWRCRGRA
jgi:hypothetical protein